jgi:Ser/Thr protein kinase RdoA (MazF antagonist)
VDERWRGILQRHGVSAADELGRGGEAHVYALDEHRVLRVHRQESADHVRRIGELYASLDPAAVPYSLPEVLDVHSDGEGSWSIERRLPGRPLDAIIDGLRGDERARALAAYVDGAAAFAALGLPTGWPGGCGELFTDEGLHAERWGDLLADRLGLQLDRARPLLDGVVPALHAVRLRLLGEARLQPGGGDCLVHGDWFPGNVLLDDDLRVSAAIDLGWLTVVGPRDHDVRSAVAFFDVRPWARPGDAEVLLAAATRHLGLDAADLIAHTRRFEQARFAFVDEDHHLHRWCVAGLRAVAEEVGHPAPGP